MGAYGSFARYYDKLTENVEYERRAQYLCSLLKANAVESGIVLDLACGTGSLTVELAKAGYDMIGVDGSADMLSIAQNKSLENGLDILWLYQDMQELDLYGTVDAVVCTLDSINHLERAEDVQKTFNGVSEFLNDGGLFIFDVNTSYKHREILKNNTFVYDTDEVYCVWQNSLNEENDEIEVSLDFFEERNGVYLRSEESFKERIYTDEEIKKWLSENGMKTIAVYDELTVNPVNDKTQRVFYVAKKVG